MLDFGKGLGFDGEDARLAASMQSLELSARDISELNDADLRELVGRLCEAELTRQSISTARLMWGGAQQAPDGGLDVELRDAGRVQPRGYLPRPDVGFQVKKHSMGKAACTKEMHHKRALRPVIAQLADVGGAYIIVSGHDSCTTSMRDARLEGMQQAIASLPNRTNLHLDFYGTDRLATWLRQHPGVALWARSKLGRPLAGWSPFGRWAHTPTGTEDSFLSDQFRSVFDKDARHSEPLTLLDGIALARARLRAPGSAVRLTGLSGVGKSRFAQALFESDVGSNALPASDVIYADLGEELSPTATAMLTYLIANNLACHIVLDNCPPEVHRSLQKQMRANDAQVRLLTIEYDISDDSIEQTTAIHLEPSSVESVSRLVQRRYPELDIVNADRIAVFSGGNARVALALASRVDSDENLSNFKDDDLFKRLFSQRKGDSPDLLRSAEILSLVYSFDTTQTESNDELTVLGAIADIGRRLLFRDSNELLERQLAQKRGPWRAILPHALSNRLALRALANIPHQDINAELLKPENIRLLTSCAHRIGYLHDSDQAVELALSWTKPGRPLSNADSFSGQALAIFLHVAPAFPETALMIIERAIQEPGFATSENKHVLTYANLLQQLAYDENLFDRACDAMLEFARNETTGKNNDSIVSNLEQLFSQRLSGTRATPTQRQAYIARLLASHAPIDRQIAAQLLKASFEAEYFSYFGDLSFGARKRGVGWVPEDEEQELSWFVGFLGVLTPFLEAQGDDRMWARQLLAGSFRSLWSVAGCHDALEALVVPHERDGQWIDVWLAIKEALAFDSGDPDTQARLEALEVATAPVDIQSEIEAYVLLEPWQHTARNDHDPDNTPQIYEKARTLGVIVAGEIQHLDQLGGRLWARHSALPHFGRGLANGSSGVDDTFNRIASSLREHSVDVAYIGVIEGFISGVSESDPGKAQAILEQAIDVPELALHAVDLLTSLPISPWASQQLISLAQLGQLPAHCFEAIGRGLRHEVMTDESFASLISHINRLSFGYLSSLQLINMRVFSASARNYTPTPVIGGVARDTLSALFDQADSNIRTQRQHALKRVADVAFDLSASGADIESTIEGFCRAVEKSRLHDGDIREVLFLLIDRFPELTLDAVFSNLREHNVLVARIFRHTSRASDIAFNDADITRLLGWCEGHQDRLEKLAGTMRAFVKKPKTENSDQDGNPSEIRLSDSVMAIMDASPVKVAIANIIVSGIRPRIWEDARSLVLKSRAKAFEALVHYPDLAVQQFTKNQLPLIEQMIRSEETFETNVQSEREKRFE